MEDDSQPFDPTQWDYTDLDFRTPQLSGIDSRGISFASVSPSPSGQRPRLPLLQLDDWDPDGAYDESPPICVHYLIEWKLQLRKGRLSKLTNDTEQNLVLAPGALWETTLKDKVDRLLRQKTPRGKNYVSEEQLCKWSPLFRAGKKLRIDISFICKEEPQGSRVVQQQGGGRGSATAQQLAQRDQLLETQEAAGQPRVWKDVYDLMRCNGNLCPGSYCYIDEQRAKRKAASLESDRPIKIVNVLPSPHGYSAAEGCTPPSSNFGTASPSVVDLTDLVIPKPINRAVDDYTEWLCGQVEDENWKAGFRSAGSITRADCLDLRHVYQDRDIGYYVNQGVKAGIARSFVEDIKIWADSL
ncbi:hypothetical protein ACHAO7_011404 [Fusarium culmorum]